MKKLEMAKLVNYEETSISQMPHSMWKTFFLALDTTLWLWWNKPVGIGGHQAA